MLKASPVPSSIIDTNSIKKELIVFYYYDLSLYSSGWSIIYIYFISFEINLKKGIEKWEKY